MREVRYQLVFDGKVSPEDEMGSVMRLETRASFAPDTHAVFSTGAPMAVLTAAVEPDDFGGFRETGEIVFGGGSLSFTTEGEGRIGDSAIPTHQLGSVLLCIESGTGAFAGRDRHRRLGLHGERECGNARQPKRGDFSRRLTNSSDVLAAVDLDFRAVDVARLFCAQKINRPRNLFRLAQTL